ncbi:GntR family transcriptional regulator [Pseudaminobacter salicylatoxidans]|uniref:GntR family transcriptional regulator n=1 Tax=Pseudaminobacter salicylatoxidans TaxID=93369 RepID=UPI0002E6892B|nr:GntR family transcriptional regulator [Pseudaminobacter salicylatoxidans]
MTAEFALNPHEPTPLYAQLYRMLRLRILDGEYAEGEAIPSETVLRDVHGITRSTVRNAVALLVKEGLVQQIRGKGTIVTYTPINHSIWNFGGFTDFSRARGQRPVTSLLSRTIEDGPEGKVLKLVRARGVAIEETRTFLNLDTSWIDLRRFPDLEKFDFEQLSLYQVMREHYGVVPTRSELTLSIVPHSDLTQQAFGPTPEVPGFICASGDVYDSTGRLVERTSVIYSPTLEMKVGMSWNGAQPRPTHAPVSA